MQELDIQRVNTYSDARFSKRVLMQHGAYLVNGELPFEVEITDDISAVVRGQQSQFYEAVIEDFRFYAEHICKFYNESGQLIKEYEPVELFDVRLSDIQPSQFFIDQEKKAAVASFAVTADSIVIPLVKSEERYISLDGHTRMAVAIALGIDRVKGFITQTDEYIYFFVNEAKKRGIYTPYDMQELSHEEYAIKWNQFCDTFFEKA